MKKILLLFCSAIVFLSSCDKKDSPDTVTLPSDYFAFGNAYGMCNGNCAHFFLLKNDTLYTDSMDRMTNPWLFSKVPSSSDKALNLRKILNNFPKYFYMNNGTTIGCPDCADHGGIYIEFMQNGVLKKYSIDTEVEKQPIEIRAFVKDLTVFIDNNK